MQTLKMNFPPAHAIRIGTMVNGLLPDPAGYIANILPHGFESFQLSFWRTLGGANLPELARRVHETLAKDGGGAVISSLAVFGNPLEAAPEDVETLQAWETAIDHVHDFGADLVCGFTGRLRGKPVDASLPRFTEVFGELTRRAADRGVRIAFENCPMGGNWETGDWNLAHQPKAWEMLFDAVPAANLGLEWEPAHQLCELIDPTPQLRAWAPRIFHLHGKDANVHWDVIRRVGIAGGERFAHHRMPGMGDSNWTDIISDLRLSGFTGSIDIEGWHDPVYRDDLEMTGQVFALNHLKRCRGGDRFIPNP